MEGVHRGEVDLLLRPLDSLDHTILGFCVCIPFSFFGSESSRSATIDFFLFVVYFFLVSRLDHLLRCGRSTSFPRHYVLFSSRPHIINMGVSLLQTVFLLVSARQAFASCAHGTFLSPRAEDGSVKVNTFGYSGEIVSPPRFDSKVEGFADPNRDLSTGTPSRPRMARATQGHNSRPSAW